MDKTWMRKITDMADDLAFLCRFFHSLNGMDRNDSLFALANKYYQENDFGQAIEIYQQIIETEFKLLKFFITWGMPTIKTGNLGYAILYYEKAKLLAPDDDDINQNLAIANARIVDKIDIIPDFFIKRWIYQLVNLLPSNTWAILSLIFFARYAGLVPAVFLFGNQVAEKDRILFGDCIPAYCLCWPSGVRSKELNTVTGHACGHRC